jgi:tRNA A37 threonylcarbamoyladenosine modification protein TsaB
VQILPSSKKTSTQNSENASGWKEIEREIVNFLIRAGKSQFVIPFSSDERNEIYFQGFFDDEGRVTIEAVSNNYLQKKLTMAQHAAMIDLGWEPPTEGIPNYIKFLDFEGSKKTKLARLISDTLRLGYEELGSHIRIDTN